MSIKQAIHYHTDADFAKLGLNRNTIKNWEDGKRCVETPISFEWWYFDAHADDGSTLVIAFHYRSLGKQRGHNTPCITFEYNGKDNQIVNETTNLEFNQMSASDERCDVQAGKSYFRGDLHEYEIHYESAKINGTFHLTSSSTPWRPFTGILAFGNHQEDYFGWLPSVPFGSVDGSFTYQNKIYKFNGSGYHDHNWGNTNIAKLVNHWYWGRAHIGKYDLITAYIISAKKYGYAPFPIFVVQEDGVVKTKSDVELVKFSTEDITIDSNTNKPYAKKVVYEYNDNQNHYIVTYEVRTIIKFYKLINRLHGLTKKMAQLIKFDGAYIRFVGKVTIEVLKDNKVVDQQTTDGIWELMYPGKVRK